VVNPRRPTIFAPATAHGRAGVAIVRVSGPETAAALQALTGRSPPPPRRAVLRRIADRCDEPIDEGLVLWFPAPGSFTGEDVAEFHLHGGRAVVDGLVAALAARPGLRLAEPGEFTRRAFENGKLDLTAAEGLIDLVAAETAAQRRQALRQLDGALGRLYDGWRARLLRALAYLEATIDFADEDLPGDLDAIVEGAVAALRADIATHLDDGGRGERLRDGIDIAIVGAPNVGKSSLLNVIARREAAIVSPQPGTTRDVIEVALDLGGYPIVFADTAGLGRPADPVESEGMARARRRAAAADLRLAVFDATAWPALDRETASLIDDDTIVAINKADLAGLPGTPMVDGRPALAISARTGAGVAALIARVTAAAGRLAGGETPALTRRRHRRALEACHAALDRAEPNLEAEVRAEELRLAATELGRITGRVDVERVLDVVFRDFCIGK
jgi:tRNA modification GTPase